MWVNVVERDTASGANGGSRDIRAGVGRERYERRRIRAPSVPQGESERTRATVRKENAATAETFAPRFVTVRLPIMLTNYRAQRPHE